MTKDIAYFMIFINEKIAERFFGGDMNRSYEVLKQTDTWEILSAHYDAWHTAGVDYILDNVAEIFKERGVKC